MDQTNPLAELTHKRRLSALGPGGLTRDRAGFEVRDVHYTHYGRMCPIETPEGPNIGLISSLSTYAQGERVRLPRDAVLPRAERRRGPQEAGVPRRRRRGPLVHRAGQHAVRQEDGEIVEPHAHRALARRVPDRRRRRDVDYMDVSPIQLVSPAAALIPFLEHDDANRALMGSNMQRQAVPLLVTEAPLVGTGLEGKVAEDSGALRAGAALGRGRVRLGRDDRDPLRARSGRAAGRLQRAAEPRHLPPRPSSAARTRTRASTSGRSSSEGPKVKKGQVIADGPATREGELALGRNVLVRVHAVGRLQLRGRHPGEREAHQGRRLHLDPHRGVRAPGARHQARRRGDHARDPERLRGGGQEPRRRGRRSASARACGRATSWSAR